MIPIEDEGILICNACSRSIPYLTENEKPSYKEPPKEVCFYAYKRINHFNEFINAKPAKIYNFIKELLNIVKEKIHISVC
jgi:DNA-directed RNA polymerase subunit F